MVVGSALGFFPDSGGFGFLHPGSGSALAFYVFSQVERRDAMASAITPPQFCHSSGPVGSITCFRPGGIWFGRSGIGFFRAGVPFDAAVG